MPIRELDNTPEPERLLEAFLEELRLHRYSVSLQDHAQRILPRLFDYFHQKAIRDIRAVTAAHLIGFSNKLARTKTKRGTLPSLQTRNSYLNTVRRFFVFLEKKGIILGNPGQYLPFQKLDTLPRAVLSERQVEELIEAPNDSSSVGKRDRAILEVFYGTAIRLTECSRLDLLDLDLREASLLVRNGKGMKDRMVPVPGCAAAALDTYLTEVRPHFLHDPKEPALFLTRWGTRLGKVSMGLLVRRYGEAAGVTISPHGLRHACATHLLRHGADIRHVQRLLGHRYIQTTARYTAVALKELREVLARAHPRERARRRRARRQRC